MYKKKLRNASRGGREVEEASSPADSELLIRRFCSRIEGRCIENPLENVTNRDIACCLGVAIAFSTADGNADQAIRKAGNDNGTASST